MTKYTTIQMIHQTQSSRPEQDTDTHLWTNWLSIQQKSCFSCPTIIFILIHPRGLQAPGIQILSIINTCIVAVTINNPVNNKNLQTTITKYKINYN